MNTHLFSTIVLVAHWIVVVGFSVRVIMRRAPVGFSLAWLAVIFSVPFVGAGVYLLFGERKLGRGRIARGAASAAVVRQWQGLLRERSATPAQLDPHVEPLHRQAERVLGFPAQSNNAIELLDDFQGVFDAIIADIDGARSTCHLSFYIWHEGGRTAEVVEALVGAAQRGVTCRALADAIGSAAFLRGPLARRLRQAGVQLAAALPTGPVRSFFVRRDLRNHRKIVAIDSRVAYTGSQNLVDPRFFKQSSGVGQWVDAFVRITGPAAAALEGVFAQDWAVETGASCDLPPVDPQASSTPTGSTVQVVPSGPEPSPEAIHQLLLTAIYGARRELVMTTPYFVPDDSMVTALLSAALRNVDVTLILPARNDSFLVRYASGAHFDDLASAGVAIALYQGGLLHTKSLTVDGVTSVFGSVNLDMRSLWLNFEISLLVYDADFTRRLRALQERYLGDCDRLDLAEWRRRSTGRRFTEDACRLLSPLL